MNQIVKELTYVNGCIMGHNVVRIDTVMGSNVTAPSTARPISRAWGWALCRQVECPALEMLTDVGALEVLGKLSIILRGS